MKNIKKFLPLLILVLVEAILFVSNYKSGTYFLGWDNLFPEMNFSGNLQRSLFAVWQEYRGLGLLDGMSFAANLPHYLFLWALSLVLPTSILRYFFFFLMHFLGGVGVYKLVSGELQSDTKRGQWVGLLSALFYLFNFATIQMFYAPYELFAVHFAFLPWLTMYILRFLRTGLRKDLILFGFVSFLAIPQAHVPTVFLVYLLFVGILLLFQLKIKRGLAILATIFVVNAYWLLPYGFFATGHTGTVIDAKINQMSRDDIYLNQKFRGSLGNVISLKGFLLDAKEPSTSESPYIMSAWRSWVDQPMFKVSSTVLVFMFFIGLVYSLVKREKKAYPFLIAALVAFFFLASDVPVLAQANDFVRTNFQIVGEIFRFSFTKFSILFVFSLTALLSWALAFFLDRVRPWLLGIIFVVILLFSNFPAFSGNFVFDALRVRVPNEYFDVVKYFSSRPAAQRVALFPQPSYWSWRFYNFGYRGSGFLWYGISQPTMDLAFNPWSSQNENYHWEISYALYSKNLPLFESVLDKYQISWLLVDKNIVSPGSPKALYYDELAEMISRSNRIKPAQTFGKIKIYSVVPVRPIKNFVSLSNNLPQVNGYKWGNLDQAHFDLGDYVVGDGIEYLHRSLFTGRQQNELEFDPKAILGTGPAMEIKPGTPYPQLSHAVGYLITVEAKNIVGKPGLFWIENLNSRRADLETYLPKGSGTYYFIQPPMEPDGLGYSFHFDSTSIGKETSINELGKITVTPIDYWGLVTRHSSLVTGTKNYLSDFQVEHPNPAFYRVDLGTVSKDTTLLLSQSFEAGWVAYAVNSKQQISKVEQHVLVNNWENGWKLTGNEKIVYIFFWPQLLEFAGFGILGGFLIWVLFTKVVQSKSF